MNIMNYDVKLEQHLIMRTLYTHACNLLYACKSDPHSELIDMNIATSNTASSVIPSFASSNCSYTLCIKCTKETNNNEGLVSSNGEDSPQVGKNRAQHVVAFYCCLATLSLRCVPLIAASRMPAGSRVLSMLWYCTLQRKQRSNGSNIPGPPGRSPSAMIPS